MNATKQLIAALPEAAYEVCAERIAIRQYDGNQTQHEAEEGAFMEISAVLLKDRVDNCHG